MGEVLDKALAKLTLEELQSLQRDVVASKPVVTHLIEDRIEALEHAGGTCSVCGSPIKDSPNSFTLIFGPAGLKKKAAICAVDCLEYYVQRLKKP